MAENTTEEVQEWYDGVEQEVMEDFLAETESPFGLTPEELDEIADTGFFATWLTCPLPSIHNWQ